MPDMTERPDTSTVETDRAHLDKIWNGAHGKWAKADDYYHRKFALWGPEHDRETVHPAQATHIIEHAADNQIGFLPRVHRDPVGEGDAHETAASNVEKALLAIFIDASLKEMVLPFKQLGKHFLHNGYGILEGPILSMAGEPPEPQKEDGEDDKAFEGRKGIWRSALRNWNPIRIRAPRPSSVLLDPEEKQPTLGIKITRPYAYKLYEMSVAKKNQEGKVDGLKANALNMIGPDSKPYSRYDKLQAVEHWTEYWHTVLAVGNPDRHIPGQVLWQEPNTWGFVPWSHAFAGFGMELSNAEEFNPEYMAVGMLDAVMEMLKIKAQAIAAGHTLLMRAAYAQLTTDDDAAELRNQMKGDIVQVGQGKELGIMPTPALNRTALAHEQMIDQDIEFGTMSSLAAGFGQPGMTTVGVESMRSQVVLKKFAAPAMQMQHMVSIAASRVLQLVDIMGHPIGVRGKVLRPSDIYHSYGVDVSFEVVDEAMDLQRKQIGMGEVAAGLKSRKRYWEEDSRIEDTSKEEERLLQDQVRKHPAVAARLALEAARRMGFEQEFAEGTAEDLADIDEDGRRNNLTDDGTAARNAAKRGVLPQQLNGQAVRPKRIDIAR